MLSPPRSGTSKGCPLLAFRISFIIVLEALASAIRRENKIEDVRAGKEETKLSLFANNMVVYVENCKGATKKLLFRVYRDCRIQQEVKYEKNRLYFCIVAMKS